MCCRETCASEFQWKNFGFSGVPREKFYMWQWRVPPALRVIYKILMSAYLISTLLYNFLTFDSEFPWPVFFTNWTYTLLTMYHVVHTVVVLHHVMYSTCHTCLDPTSHEEHQENFIISEGSEPVVPCQQHTDTLPPHLILLWVLYSIVNSMCPIITCLWYATVATPEDAFLPQELFVHALNTVVVLVDQMLSAFPVRLFHFTFPIVYGLLYYLFSILYWMADHRRVLYGKVLDWNHPAIPFGVVIIAIGMSVAFHGVSYIIYRTRLSIHHRLERTS